MIIVRVRSRMRKLCYIDLFAGCGGLSLGMCNAGWKGLFAVEKSEMAFETFHWNLVKKRRHFNWPTWLPRTHHDINEMMACYKRELRSLRGQVELVAGGPPCQGFSVAGKRRETDQRNRLIHSYIDFVKLVRPNLILFENVKGFTMGFRKGQSRGVPYSKAVLESLVKLGYKDVDGRIINFRDYGVPQRRERFILVGSLNGRAKEFFTLLEKNRRSFLAEKKLKPQLGAMAALSDIERRYGEIDCPDSVGYTSGVYSSPKNNYQRLMRQSMLRGEYPDSHRFVSHGNNTVKIFEKVLTYCEPNLKIGIDDRQALGLKKRNTVLLGKTSPSPTLMSIPDDYVHYSEPRILTVREYARLQSFPDCYEFRGNYTTGGKRRMQQVPRYTQVGNAIPPLFAEQMGEVLKELVNGEKARSI